MTTTKISKQAAIERLAAKDGHDIMTVEWGQEIADAVGFQLHVEKVRDERSYVKGAHIDGAQEGDVVGCCTTLGLMYQVASAIGYQFSDRQQSILGRGSSFRMGMKEILAKLEKGP